MTATVIGLMLSLNVCCSVGSKTLLFEGMMMQILQKVRIREILKLFLIRVQSSWRPNASETFNIRPKNAQYTSPDTQNEIIQICKSLILQKIAKDVEESGVFSITCDECTDIANQEQFFLSVWYVVREKVCESFIGFFELDEGVSGEAIAGKIEKAIADCHLDPFRLRGQVYDGAGNMSGQHKGCVAILQKNTQRLFILIVASMF